MGGGRLEGLIAVLGLDMNALFSVTVVCSSVVHSLMVCASKPRVVKHVHVQRVNVDLRRIQGVKAGNRKMK